MLWKAVVFGCLVMGWAAAGAAKDNGALPNLPRIVIPRLTAEPSLEDFLAMQPQSEAARQMRRVTGFIQRNPHDGKPVSQRTEAYLGYDNKNLYVVFVCFDDPAKVRAHLTRREDIFDDDNVEILIDTYKDERRAYSFQTNPLGVQWDAIWTETQREHVTDSDPHFDISFDTLWYSKGKLTAQGYVVWLAIPFRSLRFVPTAEQTWGIVLYRGIVREGEDAFWPEISRKIEGRMNQAATAEGMREVSPGRNMQFIPYAAMRGFRAPDFRGTPFFSHRTAEGRIGLDSKVVLRDNLVLDATINPDFSQVESDEPQITVNQRFEVFFPEKRPFFQENSDYFNTPINLLFTRRIGEPSAGIRLTGKQGPYSLGVLASDDRAPGKSVPDNDPASGERAYFMIGRVSRDIRKQSSIGAIYADRELPFFNAFNRVGGIDARLKFNANWTGAFQGLVSSTRNPNGSYQAGPAYKARIAYEGRRFQYTGNYNDFSPGFVTESGFVNRVDIREFSNVFSYVYRPRSGWLLSATSQLVVDPVWAHDGTRLDTYYAPQFALTMRKQTFLQLTPYTEFRERLRPKDFPTLPADTDFHEHQSSIFAGTSVIKQLTVDGFYFWGNGINFVPPLNCDPANIKPCQPFLARSDSGGLDLNVRPITNIKISNSYLFNRLRDKETGAAIFNNHIIRSKTNWQITRELSLRVILQYTATLANTQTLANSGGTTFLPTTRNFNADFLVTYLLHPGTAIYVGYNGNLQNIDPALQPDANGDLFSRSRMINDSRQFFVKVSYLLRF